MENKSPMRLVSWAAVLAALAGLIGWIFVQQATINRLREVRSQESRAGNPPPIENREVERLKNLEAENQQLRENTTELLRLRNEIRQLREQQEETEFLRAANTRLLELLQRFPLLTNQQAEIAAVRRKGAVLGVYARSASEVQPGAPAAGYSSGAVVLGIDANSPVASSGLKVGDVIIRLDGRPIETHTQLQIEMLTRKPGETVTLDVVRTGAVVRVPVITRALP